MKTVRITAELVQHGNIQFTRGRVKPLPDALADALVADGNAEYVNGAEYAAMPRPSNVAVVPRNRRQRGRR